MLPTDAFYLFPLTMTNSVSEASGSGLAASYTSDGEASDSPGGSVVAGAGCSVASEEFDPDRIKKPVNRDGGTRNKPGPSISESEIKEATAAATSLFGSSSSAAGGASKRNAVRKPAVYPGTRKKKTMTWREIVREESHPLKRSDYKKRLPDAPK